AYEHALQFEQRLDPRKGKSLMVEPNAAAVDDRAATPTQPLRTPAESQSVQRSALRFRHKPVERLVIPDALHRPAHLRERRQYLVIHEMIRPFPASCGGHFQRMDNPHPSTFGQPKPFIGGRSERAVLQ